MSLCVLTCCRATDCKHRELSEDIAGNVTWTDEPYSNKSKVVDSLCHNDTLWHEPNSSNWWRRERMKEKRGKEKEVGSEISREGVK